MITYEKSGSMELLDIDDYYIQTETDGWDNTLNFSLPVHHAQAADLKERLRLAVSDEVEDRTGQIYAISGYNKSGQTLSITAELDLSELSGGMILDWHNGTETTTTDDDGDEETTVTASKTLAQTVEAVLPDGWTCVDNTGREELELIEDFCGTPLELIKEAVDTWGDVAAQFDNVKDTVTLYSTESGTANAAGSKGTYFTTDLNLTETPSIKGQAKVGTYYTRLYLRGKDGLTFSADSGDVTYSGHTITIGYTEDGIGYVQDNTYDSRVISVYEEDTSITDADILLSTAEHMIFTAAEPQRAYTCKLLNLAKLKPDTYGFLTFNIYDIIVLLDPDTHSRTYQTITRTKLYPHHPEKDSVVLSTVPGTLTRAIARAQKRSQIAAQDSAIAKENATTAKATSEDAKAVADAANGVAATANGTATDAKKVADAAAANAQTAVTQSKTAVDTANEVSTTLTKSYTTTKDMNTAITNAKMEAVNTAAADATDKADAAKEAAIAAAASSTDTKLAGYTKVTETSTLSQTVDKISGRVTSIEDDYATGTDLTSTTTRVTSLETTAEGLTSDVSTIKADYVTNTQMKTYSQISQEDGQIVLKVGEETQRLDNLATDTDVTSAKMEAVNTAAADATDKADAAKTGAINDAAEKYVGNSEVRQKFADSTESSITINKGTITFESGTLIIKSNNFTLDSGGNAEFSGKITGGSIDIGNSFFGVKKTGEIYTKNPYDDTEGTMQGANCEIEISGCTAEITSHAFLYDDDGNINGGTSSGSVSTSCKLVIRNGLIADVS